jgi:hypothetical protein
LAESGHATRGAPLLRVRDHPHGLQSPQINMASSLVAISDQVEAAGHGESVVGPTFQVTPPPLRRIDPDQIPEPASAGKHGVLAGISGEARATFGAAFAVKTCQVRGDRGVLGDRFQS